MCNTQKFFVTEPTQRGWRTSKFFHLSCNKKKKNRRRLCVTYRYPSSWGGKTVRKCLS